MQKPAARVRMSYSAAARISANWLMASVAAFCNARCSMDRESQRWSEVDRGVAPIRFIRAMLPFIWASNLPITSSTRAAIQFVAGVSTGMCRSRRRWSVPVFHGRRPPATCPFLLLV